MLSTFDGCYKDNVSAQELWPKEWQCTTFAAHLQNLAVDKGSRPATRLELGVTFVLQRMPWRLDNPSKEASCDPLWNRPHGQLILWMPTIHRYLSHLLSRTEFDQIRNSLCATMDARKIRNNKICFSTAGSLASIDKNNAF